MTRYVVNGRYGTRDAFEPTLHGDELSASVDLVAGQRGFRFGIGGALQRLREMSVQPTEIGLDLMVLSALVHAADTRLNRIEASQDAWTREIRVIVPVSDSGIWDGAADTLQRMLRFLTGDLWVFEFRERPVEFKDLLRRRFDHLFDHGFDRIALFSGGLDSLIGAIDSLSKQQRPLFISHAGDGAVSKPQGDLFEALRRADPTFAPIKRLRAALRPPGRLFGTIASDNSTRGRSFLFLSVAAFAGSGLGIPFQLEIPENGLIALNVPLEPTRLGSLSTRTTHPHYLHSWNELLQKIGITGHVTNPYAFKTKGEMVKECTKQGVLKQLVEHSVSCAHPAADRYEGGGFSHCGRCVPCLIRRASIEGAWGAEGDPTHYRLTNLRAERLDATKARGVQVRAFQYTGSRLEARPGLADLLIHKPGPLGPQDDVVELAGVYRRGMAEVAKLLEGVVTYSSQAEDIA